MTEDEADALLSKISGTPRRLVGAAEFALAAGLPFADAVALLRKLRAHRKAWETGPKHSPSFTPWDYVGDEARPSKLRRNV